MLKFVYNKGAADMSINNNLCLLRKEYGLSQDDIASKLGVSRQTYSKFENGTGELSTAQIQQLADYFGVQIPELYYEVQNTKKFKQMLVYILCKFNRRGLPKTKLAKLLYLSDFAHYYTHFESMSNVLYKCKDYGPLAEPFLETIDDMYENGELHIDTLSEGAQMVAISKSVSSNDFSLLSAEEKKEMDKICEKWIDANSKEIVNFTHNQKPWMACRPGEIIPYDLILQEDPKNVY